MRRHRRSWEDLPQDILSLIHNKKLHSIDRVRFRAVCKSWRLPKDHTKLTDYPWLVSRHTHTLARCCEYGKVKYSYMYCFIDPYKSRVNCKDVYPIEHSYLCMPQSLENRETCSDVYAAKYGWRLLYGNNEGKEEDSLYLYFHNPFSNRFILLPPLLLPLLLPFDLREKLFDLREKVFDLREKVGTFTTIPTSPDCEVLVVVRSGPLYIARLCLKDKDKGWTSEVVDEKPSSFCKSIHYVDGKLYCFFNDDGMLKCYSLGDKSWECITWYPPEESWTLDRRKRCWLTEIGCKIALVCCLISSESATWMIYEFDWRRMRWINTGKDLTNITVFISCDIVVVVEKDESVDDCLILYTGIDLNQVIDDIWLVLNCYSLKNGKNVGIPEPYAWINAMWSRPEPYYYHICFLQPFHFS